MQRHGARCRVPSMRWSSAMLRNSRYCSATMSRRSMLPGPRNWRAWACRSIRPILQASASGSAIFIPTGGPRPARRCGDSWNPMPATSVDSFRLDGKTALVTGGGRGIGRAVSLALATAGAELILVSRTQSQLEEVAREIEKGGGTARVVPFDVTDPAAMRAAFVGIPRLDILVNN